MGKPVKAMLCPSRTASEFPKVTAGSGAPGNAQQREIVLPVHRDRLGFPWLRLRRPRHVHQDHQRFAAFGLQRFGHDVRIGRDQRAIVDRETRAAKDEGRAARLLERADRDDGGLHALNGLGQAGVRTRGSREQRRSQATSRRCASEREWQAIDAGTRQDSSATVTVRMRGSSGEGSVTVGIVGMLVLPEIAPDSSAHRRGFPHRAERRRTVRRFLRPHCTRRRPA